MNQSNADEQRAEYVAGLRALADLLEQNNEVPLPYHGRSTELSIFTHDKAELVATARAFPGKLDKQYDENSASYGFELHGAIRGLRVVIYGDRNEVCRRVVTGTHEVTKTVPAPDAPTVEVTETVEDVEWVCEPLLAAAVSS